MLFLAGCGRVDFDALSSGGQIADGKIGSDATVATIPPGAGIWLKMETDPAVNIIDSAGGHSAGCTDCPTSAMGKHGQGFHFNGNDLHVDYAADVAPGTAFTAGVWFILDALPPGQGVVWAKPRDTNGFDTFTMFVDNTGIVTFDCDDFGGIGYGFNGGAMVALHEWHHIALTYDGTTLTGYLDGSQVASSPATCDSMPFQFELGSENNGLFMTGTVDDAVFYTRVLAAAEIMQLAAP